MKSYENIVSDLVAKGWRVEGETRTHTLMAKGERLKHWAHILLTLGTAGIWGFIYGPLLAFGGLRQRRVVRLPNGDGRVERVY